MAIFAELEQKHFKFAWKHRRLWLGKTILKNKNGAGGISYPDFRLLQSYSNQNSMVLKQKQTYRPMDRDRNSRNKPMHVWSINVQQMRQEYTV